MKKLLVACEESQRVTAAFRAMGWEAYSCDVQEPSGGHPDWHILGDCLPLLNGDCTFRTMDGEEHRIDGQWDMLIAHPPCTYLTVAGNRWFDVGRYGDKAVVRAEKREAAAEFFMAFVKSGAGKIAIENPIGYMSTRYKKPTQIIQPYMFGDPERKATCLWLQGLEPLSPTNVVKPNIVSYKNGQGTDSYWHISTLNLPAEERAKARSKTFLGIANAMAEQWG